MYHQEHQGKHSTSKLAWWTQQQYEKEGNKYGNKDKQDWKQTTEGSSRK